MMTALAIFIGVAAGSLLAWALTRGRRRPRLDSEGRPIPRPSLVGTPAQRLRALWMAAGITALAIVLVVAGAGAWAGPVLLLGLLLAGQAVVFEAVARLKARDG
jgi:hypothetical protein